MAKQGMNGGIADQLLALGLVSKKDYDHKQQIDNIEKKKSEKKNFSFRDPEEASLIVWRIRHYSFPLKNIGELFELIKEAVLNDYTSIKEIVTILHTLRDNGILCEPESPHNDPFKVIPFALNLRKELFSAKFLNAPSHEQEKTINHLFNTREEHYPPRIA